MRFLAKRTWLVLGALSVASLGCRHAPPRPVAVPACDHCSVIVASRTSSDPKVLIVETPQSTGSTPVPISVKPTEPKSMPSKITTKSMPSTIPTTKESVVLKTMPSDTPKVSPMKESIKGSLELPKMETSLPNESASPPLAKPSTTTLTPFQPLQAKTTATTSLKPSVSFDRKGRAADYSWLVGQLEHSKLKNTWRVRYANRDVEDAYGGSVTLVGADDLLESLKDGDLIKVEGQLLSPEMKATAPTYRVLAVKKLD
jgi:hypothetical protein